MTQLVVSLCISFQSPFSIHFLLDQEDELEELMMYYVQSGFPFSDDKLCQLAFELASKTKRKGFLLTKKIAGHKWLCGYL